MSGADLPPRAVPRKRVLFGRKLVYAADGAFTADCTIKDISDGGARIQLGKRESIPAHVTLIDVRAGAAYEAEVVWRRAPQFGLRFLGKVTLNENHPVPSHLGRLWNAIRH